MSEFVLKCLAPSADKLKAPGVFHGVVVLCLSSVCLFLSIIIVQPVVAIASSRLDL